MRFSSIALALVVGMLSTSAPAQTTLSGNNEIMFRQLQSLRGVSAARVAKVKAIFKRSGYMGQGNPAATKRPMAVKQCLGKLPGGSRSGAVNSRFTRICGAKYMAPLYDPASQRPEDAKACIDQYEYPNIPCTYPVTWVKASEAAQICAAEGKRLCDAHEWEGACQGSVGPPDYRFDLAGGGGSGAVARMRAAHNAKYGGSKRWSYGPAFKRGVCAQNSTKSPGCNGGNFRACGTNTYPTGAFRGCTSRLKVYDLNGNAAEHMNLPLTPQQMASNNPRVLGVTEMKGSWFIWDKFQAHPDWCRWRAPFWHGTAVQSAGSHSNYHLGFRCCKSVK